MSKRSRLKKQVAETATVTHPAMTVGGHVFPAFTGLDAAFGADLSAYPAIDSIPDEFQRHGSKFNTIASSLFFKGGRLSDHGIDIIQNFALERVQIVFAGKPDDETRGRLKSAGWRWSPREGAWQRKLTNNALYSAKHVIGAAA